MATCALNRGSTRQIGHAAAPGHYRSAVQEGRNGWQRSTQEAGTARTQGSVGGAPVMASRRSGNVVRPRADNGASGSYARGIVADVSISSRCGAAYLKNSTFASRKKTKFTGATEMGPLMPKMAIWNLSPGWTVSASTTRLGMLKPWMVAGLG